jgi:RNA polymerase sigma factor (sigma-70 family)
LCTATRRDKIAPLANDYTKLSAEELLSVCANLGDVLAWDEFIRRFQVVVHATVMRTAGSFMADPRSISDDLEQEVFVKFSANGADVLRRFVPREPGSAYGYVKVIAARVVYDYFRSKAAKETPESAHAAENIPAPDEAARRMLLQDIDGLLRKIAAERDREIFWLYYVHGMTTKEIASLAGIDLQPKGVESVLTRLGLSLRKHLADSEGKARGSAVP